MRWSPALTAALLVAVSSAPNFPDVSGDGRAYLKTSRRSWQMALLEPTSDVAIRPSPSGVPLAVRVRRHTAVVIARESGSWTDQT
jgi:hypothetical protein